MNKARRAYRQLDAQRIVETADRLQARVAERFPDSGLSRVARELADIARETVSRAARIGRPNILLRAISLALCGVLVWLIVLFIRGIKPDTVEKHLSDALDVAQFAESTLGTIVFLGAFILFLVTIERRIKRGRAIDAIYELRSLAHVVDMHQLTKDPERTVSTIASTASSPTRTMTPFELGRYLDYCSELLSLISKVAVLYVEGVKDEEVLDAVDQIETLTTGLSRKIWQKISLLDRFKSRAASEASPGTPPVASPAT